MLAPIEVLKGRWVPQHQHAYQQITVILAHLMRPLPGEEEGTVRAGEIVIVPGNLTRIGEAFEHEVRSDIVAPPQSDWINGANSYLKHEG